MAAAAQLSPAPKPTKTMFWPGLTLPASMASHRAMGMLAVLVLPYFCRLMKTFSSGIFSWRRMLFWMMRLLAWWGMTRSTSSTARPAFSRTWRVASAMTRTAKRKTALPSILM